MTIGSFDALYRRMVEDRPILAQFLTGHLVLEYLIRRLVISYDPQLTRLANDLGFARLVALAFDVGVISEKMRGLLLDINGVRNKFAHRVAYSPGDDLKELFLKAKNAVSDMTDGIAQGLEVLAKTSDMSHSDVEDWAVKEFFIQISYDLNDNLHERDAAWPEF